MCNVPAWVTAGWYGNNPDAQKAAKLRWHVPVATPEEVARSKAHVVGVSYPCAKCDKFAFPKANTVCYWCSQQQRRTA